VRLPLRVDGVEKGSSANSDTVFWRYPAAEVCHDGSTNGRSEPVVLLFNLERRIPVGHLLRRINPVVTRILVELREKLAPFYALL
jgi:hypothetical protein